MIKLIEKYPILSLFFFVILMLGFTIDSIPVSIMEARNFISAREMLTDGNWILTTMNGEARYEKPPMPTWITAAFGMIFGIKSVLALRFPTLLFVASIGISTYLLSNKMKLKHSHSVANGFIAITSFYVIGITIEAPWDIYAHGFMLMALYQLFLLFQIEKTRIISSGLFVIFLAFSVLSKGPVSLYALFLPFVIAYGIAYKFQGKPIHFLKVLSLLVFGIVLGGWWYFHVRIADPETFTAIAERETSNWSSYNVRPFYYYWSFFVQSGIWTIPALISLIYPYMKSRVTNLKAYRFSFFWTIFAVILLSIIPEKKSRYLMPVLIPLAFNIGFYINYLFREFKNLTSKKETIPVYFQFGLIGFLACAFGLSYFFLADDLFGWMLFRWVATVITLMIIGIVIFKYLKAKEIKSVFYLTLLFMLSLGFLAVPLVKTQIQENFNSVSNLDENGFTTYSLNVAPETVYDFGKKIPSLKTEDGYLIPAESQFNLLVNSDNSQSLEELSQYYHIELIGTYDLNMADENAKGHKPRLVNNFYRLTKK
ncbi:ArnT family glycosyltransferase [Winogradskyella ursingii]|uniref:ArnT family glycosyltransferase n=1 Tax=Winogradskyella ursingii TaxID=2686079 RepID=UPI0015CDABC5|nr:glycosyltransferase family 39 protein [Winogradskyella ursingii]